MQCRPRRIGSCRTLLLVATATVVVPSSPSAQVPPPGTPATEIRQQISAQGLQAALRGRIQASGLTPDQIRQRLAQAGYDPSTLDPYLRDTETPPEPSDQAVAAARLFGIPEMAPQGRIVGSTGTAAADAPRGLPAPSGMERRTQLRVFGLDVFARGASEFEPVISGPIPPSYIVGPGDELVLVLTGDVEKIHELPVTREGFIVIPQVGQVWVNGLTMRQLRDRLQTVLGGAYSGISREGDATTHFEVSLARLRSNQVFTTGEVQRPGAYLASPLASVLNVLYLAGGPTANGSFRDVRIVRGGQMAQRIDLYDYLLAGDNLSDIILEPGDVVFVPVHRDQVAIRGEVAREAIYELLPGETLADLVTFAGGLATPAATNRARIERILPPSQRTTPGVERVVTDVNLSAALSEPAAAPDLQPGDDVRVFRIRGEVRKKVELAGSVWHPGSYEYRPGMTVRDLIARGQGLQPEAYLARAQIVRLNREDSTLSVIPVTLDTLADGTPVEDPELREFDTVRVFSMAAFEPAHRIEVRGAVRNPGGQPRFQGMTIADAILRAGGLVRETYTDRAYISRLVPADSTRRIVPVTLRVDSQMIPLNTDTLEDHDIIQVYGLDRFFDRFPVTISGEVRDPGTEAFQEDLTLEDLIIRAGGLKPSADLTVEVARLADPEGRKEGRIAEIIRIDVDSAYIVSDQSMRYYPGRSTPGDDGAEPGSAAAGFLLRPYDHITVRRLPDFEMQRTVTLTGQFQYPGTYALRRKDERLRSVIERAGGLKGAAHPGGFRLFRRGALVGVDFEAVLQDPSHRDNLVLLPGDSMTVPEYNPVVVVQGAVQSPSAVIYREGADLGYYIDRAGGYDRHADRKRVFVQYENGESRSVGRFLFFRSTPTPLPGSVVVVPETPESDRVNAGEVISDVAQIAATLTTILLLISRF